MAILVVKDQVQQGKDRLVTQWAEKVTVQGLLKSYLENVQTIETIYDQLLKERSVFTAIGTQLDNIGVIVGESRLGRSDAVYRQAVLNRVAINRADGTPETIVEILMTITDSTIVTVFEHYPANVHVFINGSPSNETVNTLEVITPVGVSAVLMFDGGVDSYIGATVTQAEFELALENDDFVGLENNDILGISNTVITPVKGRSSFPHLLETAIKNPLCGLLEGISTPR